MVGGAWTVQGLGQVGQLGFLPQALGATGGSEQRPWWDLRVRRRAVEGSLDQPA